MALYKIFKVGDKELKLRLRSRDCVDLENRLGESPLDRLMRTQNGKVPTVGFMVAVLHSSLQAFEHGYTLDETYKLYDEYVDNGGTLDTLLPEIIDIFEVSGFFKQEKKKEEELEKEHQVKEEIQNVEADQIPKIV